MARSWRSVTRPDHLPAHQIRPPIHLGLHGGSTTFKLDDVPEVLRGAAIARAEARIAVVNFMVSIRGSCNSVIEGSQAAEVGAAGSERVPSICVHPSIIGCQKAKVRHITWTQCVNIGTKARPSPRCSIVRGPMKKVQYGHILEDIS